MTTVRETGNWPSCAAAWLRRLWCALKTKRPHWLTSTALQRRGARAESAAVKHLRRLGHEIIATNLMTRHGEVDILSREGDWLVFSEVRSCQIGQRGFERPAFPRDKQERFARAMDTIVRQRGWEQRRRRADLIEVYLDDRGRVARVNVVKAAIPQTQYRARR